MNKVNHNSGFTLIEVVIALAVFAIVGTLAFSGLNMILKWQTNLNDKTNQLQAVQLTLKYLERDINQAIDRSVRDQYGDTQPAFTSNVENELDLTYSGWRNPAGLSRSIIQRVSYRIEDNNLIRHTWNRLDGALEDDARDIVLLEGIEEINWNFISNEFNESNRWPPLNAGPDIASLPKAVSVNFSVEPFGEITRIFTIPQ